MRAIWSGTISFGLVNIPVKLYTAVEDQAISFDILHKKDLSPIRYAKVCRAEGEEIAYQDTVKGYEVQKGDYVVLEDKDFERANARKTHTIDILSFTDERDIEPIYYDRPYYLEPDKGGENAYVLLREAMKKAEKAAVAKFVFRNREHLCVIEPEDGVLALDTLRFKTEIRKPTGLKIPEKTQTRHAEMQMALELIDQLAAPFRPESYKDTYTEELKRVIDAKSHGRAAAPKGESPAPTRVADLMAALKASLENAKTRV